MDDVYLLNSPFTFQSMEKHAAYCAMIRLGLQGARDGPGAVQAPAGQRPVRVHRGALQPAVRPGRGRRAAGLSAVHEAVRRRRLGRRLPDRDSARAARGVRRVRRAADAPAGVGRGLRRVRPVAVDRAGDDGDEVPARAADARAVRGRPRLPGADDGRRGGDASPGWSTRSSGGSSTRARRWYATATSTRSTTPTPARTWRSRRCTTTSRGRWRRCCAGRVFCVVTGRKLRLDTDTAPYFAIADRADVVRRQAGGVPAAGRRVLRDRPVPRVLRRAAGPRRRDGLRLGRLAEFDALLVETVRATYPAHEHDRFVAHFRGLVGLWVSERGGARSGRSARVQLQVGGEAARSSR